MEYIYFATQKDGLVDNYEIARMYELLNGSHIFADDFAVIRAFAKTCKGIKKEIKKPSIDFILMRAVKDEFGFGTSEKALAMKLYRREHDCTLREAKDYIDTKFDKMKAKYQESNR